MQWHRTSGRTRPAFLARPADYYWFTELLDSRALYIQGNAVADMEQESFARFTTRVFDSAEAARSDRLVLDLRFNTGGNNYLNRPFLLAVIRSKFNQPGKLFCLIGRRTFSAAQNLVNDLQKYTSVVFIGEPTASNVNFYGDAARVDVPSLGLAVRASTLWWQDMDPRDKRPWTGPQLAVEYRSADYEQGTDPALAAALAYEPETSTSESVQAWAEKGTDQALAAANRYLDQPEHKYVSLEREMNRLGYLLMDQGKLDEAFSVLEWNANRYAGSSNAFDSLGEVYRRRHLEGLATVAYRRAVELDASNLGAAAALAELQGQR